MTPASGGNDSIWAVYENGIVGEWTGNGFSDISPATSRFKEIAVDRFSNEWAISADGTIKKFKGRNPLPELINHYEECLKLSRKRMGYTYYPKQSPESEEWKTANLPILCKGTKNYIKTVDCYETFRFVYDNNGAVSTCANRNLQSQLLKFGTKDANGEITSDFLKSSLNESSSAIAFRLMPDSTTEQNPPPEKFNSVIEK